MEEKQSKIIKFRNQKRDRRAIATFFAVLVAVALVLSFFGLDGGRNFDRARRYLLLGNEPLEIRRGTAAAGAQVDGNLVTAGEDGVILYGNDGKTEFVVMAELSAPVLQTDADRILAYDAGGRNLLVLDEQGHTLMDYTDQGMIYDADLGQNGTVAVLSAGTKEKTLLQVYDPEGLLSYTLRSDTRYLSQCTVSPKGNYVCAVGLTQSKGSFESSAVIYDTEGKQQEIVVPLGNETIYDVSFADSNTIFLVGEHTAFVVNLDGEIVGSLEYSQLLDFDLGGKKFCTLHTESIEGETQIVTLNQKGKILGSVVSQAKDVAACGKYVAWLENGNLMVSGKDLQAKSMSVTQAANRICLGDLGVVYLMDNLGAQRYLP